jgi:ACR3 family arsenite efflux pump ArsB
MGRGGIIVMHSESIPEISIWTAIMLFLITPLVITVSRKILITKKKAR